MVISEGKCFNIAEGPGYAGKRALVRRGYELVNRGSDPRYHAWLWHVEGHEQC